MAQIKILEDNRKDSFYRFISAELQGEHVGWPIRGYCFYLEDEEVITVQIVLNIAGNGTLLEEYIVDMDKKEDVEDEMLLALTDGMRKWEYKLSYGLKYILKLEDKEEDDWESDWEQDFLSNAPCDNSGYCAGTNCPRYFECQGSN